jgi:DNA-binding NtrC family response regulator
MYFPLMSPADNIRRQARPLKLERGYEHIIVIDDEKDVAGVIGGMLESLGYHITIVDSGRKAINLFNKKNTFDVVILDLNMPKMSGKETFMKLKKINPDIHIIISTGYSDQDLDMSSWRGEVDGFLQKPYQIEALSRTVRFALDNKRAKRRV